MPGAASVTSRAQWGSLRDQLGRLRSAGGREAVERWLTQTRQVRQRRAVWGEPALDALKDLLTSEPKIWSVLGLDGANLDPYLLAPDRASTVRTALWPQAVSALIAELTRGATRQLQSPIEPGSGPGARDEAQQ